MPLHLSNVVMDYTEPADAVELAEFWAALLPGWTVRPLLDVPEPEVDVVPPVSDGCPFELVLGAVPEAKTGKNRVHLDLASATPAAQQELVERALSLGAGEPDIGQGTAPWKVLADRAGNEFCVLEPRDTYTDTGAIAAVVVDVADPGPLAAFWAEVLDWDLVNVTEEFASMRAPDGHGPWLELLRTNDRRVAKNRLHLDLRPYPEDDRQAEVDRMYSLGARLADFDQSALPWTTLLDPDGNEFCILTPGKPLGA